MFLNALLDHVWWIALGILRLNTKPTRNRSPPLNAFWARPVAPAPCNRETHCRSVFLTRLSRFSCIWKWASSRSATVVIDLPGRCCNAWAKRGYKTNRKRVRKALAMDLPIHPGKSNIRGPHLLSLRIFRCRTPLLTPSVFKAGSILLSLVFDACGYKYIHKFDLCETLTGCWSNMRIYYRQSR